MMKIIWKAALVLTLVIYLSVLTKLILFKHLPIEEIINHFNFSTTERYWRSNNFIPFKTIIFYMFIADVNFNIRIENLVGNIIGFAPFGFLLPLLSKRLLNLKAIIFATFCLSFTYEILQLLFELGSFDVDDLILNTFGGILGYIPIKVIKFILESKKRHSSLLMQ